MEKKLCDIQKGIANTLNNMSDIDAQITSLKGFYDKNNIGWKHVCLYHNDETLYDSSKLKEQRSFFLQDYEMIGDAQLDEYKLVTITSAFWGGDRETEITDTVEKRFYMLCIVILNEKERLKQLKKGKWNGKLHKPLFQLTQKQEELVLKLFEESEFQGKITTTGDYLEMIRNYNLSRLYNQRKLKRKCCVFLNALIKVLGDEWGETAVPLSSNGEKTLDKVKKYPISEELKRILSEYKN